VFQGKRHLVEYRLFKKLVVMILHYISGFFGDLGGISPGCVNSPDKNFTLPGAQKAADIFYQCRFA
jgi:hypothetical protein